MVVLFHRVGNEGHALWPALSADIFRETVRYLKRHYEIIGINQYAEARNTGRKAAVISFDDGFRDFYTTAWPILCEEGITTVNHNLIPACIETGLPPWTSILHARVEQAEKEGEKIVFNLNSEISVSADFSREKAFSGYARLYRALCSAPAEAVSSFVEDALMPYANKLDLPKMMNAAEIAELEARGMEIGVHSYSHLMLRECTDHRILYKETAEAKSFLEKKFSVKCETFAFPNGICDPESLEAAKAAGFKNILMAGMHTPWINENDPNVIPRTSVHHEDMNVNRLRIALQLP